MSGSEVKRDKGRLWWMIPLLEIVAIIAYFAIAYSELFENAASLNIVGMFEGVKTAIIFLIVAIAVLTLLCFIPVFKSRGNIRWAIFNIIWIVFNVSTIM